MAVYLPDQNALFLRIPHTYSELVRTALQRTLGLRTMSVGNKYSHKDLVGTLREERAPYTFTFVRHPLDWYASFWQAKMREATHWGFADPTALWQPMWPIDPACGDDDFATFVENVCERGAYLHETYRLYTGRGTGDEIHFVGKAERLLDDLSTVLTTIGVNHERSELSALSDLKTRRRDMFTPELAELVAHSERDTFADYGYPGPRQPTRERVKYPLTIQDIPGWFPQVDRQLFRALLSWQVLNEPPGDLVELGAYLGKSAVVIDEAVQPGETFTVCDLFGEMAQDSANLTENQRSYATLNREQFERNFRRFRPALPVVLQIPTSEVLEHVKPQSARFVHVDASHLYEHVAQDVVSARTMLRTGGIVVFDDFRSHHTPGVAAAVWEAVLNSGLQPIVLTLMKWYGTWDDPAPARQAVRDWCAGQPEYVLDTQDIRGREVLSVYKAGSPTAPKPQEADQAAGDPPPGAGA